MLARTATKRAPTTNAASRAPQRLATERVQQKRSYGTHSKKDHKQLGGTLLLSIINYVQPIAA